VENIAQKIPQHIRTKTQDAPFMESLMGLTMRVEKRKENEGL
jgi:hypothetical protein